MTFGKRSVRYGLIISMFFFTPSVECDDGSPSVDVHRRSGRGGPVDCPQVVIMFGSREVLSVGEPLRP